MKIINKPRSNSSRTVVPAYVIPKIRKIAQYKKQGLGFFIFYVMDPDHVHMDPLKIATYFTMSKQKIHL